jgi:hypothetical protein
LNFTASDNVAIDSCWYKLDGGASVFGCTNTTFSAADGIHNMSVYTNDTAGNSASASVIFTVDTIPPSVQLSSPTNGTTLATTTVQFTFTAVDNLSATMNCSLFLDGALNATNSSTLNSTPTTFTVLNVIDNPHNWSVSCKDLANNTGSSVLRTFFVDTSTHHEPPTSSPTLTVDLDSTCSGNTVNVMSGSSKVAGARVLVDNADTLADITLNTSDSNGKVKFQGCGINVRIRASKDGYQTIEVTKQVIDCQKCVECVTSNNCPDSKQCIDQKCVALDCGCGAPQNHKCVAYQCCSDTSCTNGQICDNHSCVKKVGCVNDSGCSNAQYCDAGNCKAVTGCGTVANHILTTYECGDGAGCASCQSGKICTNHACAAVSITAPPNGTVGQTVQLKIMLGNAPCSSCDVKVTLPDGTTMTGKTDANGNFALPLGKPGTYSISVMKDGKPVKTITVGSAPRAQPVVKPTPQPSQLETALPIIGILLIILLAACLIWFLAKKKKPAKKEEAKYQSKKK